MRLERLGKLKKSNYLMGNRTSDESQEITVCNAERFDLLHINYMLGSMTELLAVIKICVLKCTTQFHTDTVARKGLDFHTCARNSFRWKVN
jgi:hypothetical protein